MKHFQFSNNDAIKKLKWCIYSHLTVSPGKGGIPYKSDGNDHRRIEIKLLRETNVGVAQALTDPLQRRLF